MEASFLSTHTLLRYPCPLHHIEGMKNPHAQALAQLRHASLTPARRSEIAKHAASFVKDLARTPEQRSEASTRAAATRKRNRQTQG